jgi:hypothetical protein
MEKTGRISWNEMISFDTGGNLRRTAEKGVLFVTALKKKTIFVYSVQSCYLKL